MFKAHSKLMPSPSGLGNARSDSISSPLISFYVCLWIIVVFAALSTRFDHWFIIPVLLCGVLIGVDAVDWFRGRLDLFDPIGILGLLGLHFFFLAPLFHVLWNLWTLYRVTPPPDWRDWLGNMAFLNLLSLLAYRAMRNVRIKTGSKVQRRSEWRLERKRFFIIIGGALLISGLAQIWVYVTFGGILSFIQASTGPDNDMKGFGVIFMISESFPILALMAFAVYASRKEAFKSWVVIGFIILVYFTLKLLFGGLRGSRSTTIFDLFWAVGIIHFWLRPITKKLIYMGLIFLLAFMYVFGFYKNVGIDAVQAFNSARAMAEMEERTNTNFKITLLGDLGRSDIQAFLLYQLVRPDSDYEYALGRTYVGALFKMVPRSIMERPPTKVKEGTEAQYGRGSYIPKIRQSSKVYGLAGETMLNFGPFAVPFSFLVLGGIVAWSRYLLVNIRPGDSRLLLLPFLISLCFIILISDSNNVVFFLFKNGGLPAIVLILSSTKLVLSDHTQETLS